MKRFLLGFSLGVFIAMMVVNIESASRYLREVPAPSSGAVSRPLRDYAVPHESILSGAPVIRNTMFSRTSGGRTGSGVWILEGPAVVDFAFGQDENLYILEGSVDIDYLGNRFTLNTGDAAFFRAGTTATWHVDTSVKKAWIQHDPGRFARFLRRLFG